MSSFRCILFATDFSDASRKAFEETVAVAKESGAELVIAHAYQPPSLLPTDLYIAPAVYDELDTGLRMGAEKKLAMLAQEARRSGARATWRILDGLADEAIVEAAAETPADLIVVGTHARTGVSRFFLGSVASRVISSAPCPVLTVRAKESSPAIGEPIAGEFRVSP